MDRAFRLTLRAAFSLLVLVGIVLVFSSVLGGRPAPRQDQIAIEPAGRPAESATPSGAPQTAEPEPAAARQDAAEPAAPPPRGERDDMDTEIYEFLYKTRDEESDATIRGSRGSQNPATGLYDILEPIVIASFLGDADSGVDVSVGELNITARRASLDEAGSIVQLFEEVTAIGEDFDVRTDAVTYRYRERTLDSDAPVTIKKFSLDEAAGRTPEMTVTGVGLRASFPLKRMVLERDAVARLHEVSEDFLAAGDQEEGDEPLGEVVITSDGRMTYDHFAHKVTFRDNVEALVGDRTLRCSELTILLDEQGEDLAVSAIDALGAVDLQFGDQTARGERFEWQQVTHRGLLSGRPALLKTDDFELTGETLTFYRLNSQFQSEGVGRLLWMATGEPDAAGPDAPENAGPLDLSAGDPIEVTWTESMLYDVNARRADLRGDVVARQEGSTLECDALELVFAEASDEIRNIIGRGNVSVRDEWTGMERDIRCHQLLWDARERTVDMEAAEGQVVTIGMGDRTIASRRVIFDNNTGALECPAGGRLSVTPAAGEAEDQAEGGIGDGIDVTWQRGMHFRQDPERVAVFSGDVRARRSEQFITAQTLQVDFDEEMNAVRVVALGDSSIDVYKEGEEPEPAPQSAEQPVLPGLLSGEGEHWRLECDEFVIVPPEEKLSTSSAGSLVVFEGDEVGESITWHESMRLDLVEGYALFVGSVAADFPSADLKTDSLRLDFNEAHELRHISADGSVDFRSKGGEAWILRSKSAEAILGANNELKQFIARGDVRVRDERRTMTAGMLQLLLNEVEGRPRPVITRAVAQRDVLVRYEDEEDPLEAGGDRLDWDRPTDLYTLTGEPHAFLRPDEKVELRGPTVLLHRQTGKWEFPDTGGRPVETILRRSPQD